MIISIIIPVKPDGYVSALEQLRHLDADPADYEVIVAEGKKPSRQRNLAAAAAQGDIIYFLDDDAAVRPDVLKQVTAAFSDANVAVVGGPSITPAEDTPFQRTIAMALSSAFGGGAIRNRYRRFGSLRDTDDSELILCNLAFRKEVYLANGGLDERLYPNEENELIDRLLASGVRLLHNPAMFVTRSQRKTYPAFIRQMLTYGRGRAEQSLLTRSLSFKAVIPAVFASYLLSLPFFTNWWYCLPAFIYLLVLTSTMLIATAKAGVILAIRLPIIYTLLHFCYGFGFILGLFLPRYKNGTDDTTKVRLRHVKKPGASWSNEGRINVLPAI